MARHSPAHQGDGKPEPLRRVQAELVDIRGLFLGVPRRTVIFVPDTKAPFVEPLACGVDVIDLPHQRTDLARTVFGRAWSRKVPRRLSAQRIR